MLAVANVRAVRVLSRAESGRRSLLAVAVVIREPWSAAHQPEAPLQTSSDRGNRRIQSVR